MAAWRHRVARDCDGKLHFVFARYDTSDPRYRCGMLDIFNEGSTLDDMRRLVHELEAACNHPIIEMTETGFESDEDADEDEDANFRLSDLGPD
jgi:hypothetical protein